MCRAEEIFSGDEKVLRNGSALRKDVEYLNREFDGSFCADWISWAVVEPLTGDLEQRCLVPAKPRENFAGFEFSGATLNDVQLPGAVLSCGVLTEANLGGAKLSNAGLFNADLSNADLSKADLREADLREAELNGADLFSANLQGSTLRGRGSTTRTWRAPICAAQF